jgi:mannosyltransferase OCH1-like enzyme
MIPKKIHYCWFGGNPLPKSAKKCIKSWKKYCSDYQIIEWNENNFDISSAPLYVRQAYEAKKWAFVTDYVRLYALYTNGGIYMDTDVEVIKPLDVFLKHKAFSGFEDDTRIPTGIMAAEKEHPLFKEWLDQYNDKKFLLCDGTLNLETNVVAITKSMKKSGMQFNNTLQTINDCTFYPNDYFCPLNNNTGKLDKTENTYTIHWFSTSWLSPMTRLKKKITRPLHRIFGEDVFHKRG